MSIRKRILNWHIRCSRSMLGKQYARDLGSVQPMSSEYAELFAMMIGPVKPYNKNWEQEFVQLLLPEYNCIWREKCLY